jgi:predicted TIM-barrel fold metal-dependent hydrolase
MPAMSERVIDIYTHLAPPEYLEAMRTHWPDKGVVKRLTTVPMLCDVAARCEMTSRWPGYQQVLCLCMPPPELLGGPDRSPEFARMANDGLAEVCARHPNEFPAFVASLPMNNVPEALQEMDRAIEQLGARGVQICTHVNGRALDDPAFFPIFERMSEVHDLPIWLHPLRPATAADYPTEQISKYEIWQVFGWPYDTSVAMARIVFSGLFDRLPDLKLITHHLGAIVPYVEGRIGPLWDQIGMHTDDASYEGLLAKLAKRPAEYFRMFLADTAIGGSAPALRCGLEFFGTRQVLFASDCPFDSEGGAFLIRENLRALDRTDLSHAEKTAILSENARRLLRIE